MLEQLKDQLPILQYAHVLWGFGLFVGLTLWVYWPARKEDMRRYAAQILTDDAETSATAAAKRGRNVEKY